MSILHIELQGTPAEMGEQHGETLRDAINELAESRFILANSRLGGAASALLRDVSLGLAWQTQQSLPDVYKETAATARAAGLPYWKLVLAGAFSDVLDIASRRIGSSVKPPAECTIAGLKLDDGPAIVGTWDSHGSARGGLALCLRKPRRGPNTLALTTAGWPLQQGLNNGGLAAAIANAVSRDVATGIPYIALLPRIMSQSTVVGARHLISEHPHASARIYVLADLHETTAVQVVPGRAAFESSDNVQANHLTGDAVDFEGRPDIVKDSEARCLSFKSLIATASAVPATARGWLDRVTLSPVVQSGTNEGDDWTHVVFSLAPKKRIVYYRVMTRTSGTECISNAEDVQEARLGSE